MQLNPDCIRDILLTVEENTGYMKGMQYPNTYNLLDKYPQEEVLYHIKQCDLTGFFTKVNKFMGGGCTIMDLSPQGHEFLANIRTEENWDITKYKAEQVGSFSLSTLSNIAGNVISNIISQKFI